MIENNGEDKDSFIKISKTELDCFPDLIYNVWCLSNDYEFKSSILVRIKAIAQQIPSNKSTFVRALALFYRVNADTDNYNDGDDGDREIKNKPSLKRLLF